VGWNLSGRLVTGWETTVTGGWMVVTLVNWWYGTWAILATENSRETTCYC